MAGKYFPFDFFFFFPHLVPFPLFFHKSPSVAANFPCPSFGSFDTPSHSQYTTASLLALRERMNIPDYLELIIVYIAVF